jgi:hypothetical protein
VVGVALVAFPAESLSQEIHLEPGNGEATTEAGAGAEVRTEGGPTVTCESLDGSGKYDAGSSTTGSFVFDLTGCHTTVFGITAQCRSEGSALSNTIAISGGFHLITWKNAAGTAFPAILLTPNPYKVVCAGISTITVTGTVIGTITSPKCGESSKNSTRSFTATGTKQDHITYTGSEYDLRAYTGTNVANEKTSGLVLTYTTTSSNPLKLNCT